MDFRKIAEGVADRLQKYYKTAEGWTSAKKSVSFPCTCSTHCTVITVYVMTKSIVLKYCSTRYEQLANGQSRILLCYVVISSIVNYFNIMSEV